MGSMGLTCRVQQDPLSLPGRNFWRFRNVESVAVDDRHPVDVCSDNGNEGVFSSLGPDIPVMKCGPRGAGCVPLPSLAVDLLIAQREISRTAEENGGAEPWITTGRIMVHGSSAEPGLVVSGNVRKRIRSGDLNHDPGRFLH